MPDVSKSTYATGRRKHAVARVWLQPGSGKIAINNRSLEDYFGRETSRMVFRPAAGADRDVGTLRRVGQRQRRRPVGPGGRDSPRHLARLIKIDPAHRPSLKKAGYLTRDARQKERKKYGQRGARARFQFSKR